MSRVSPPSRRTVLASLLAVPVAGCWGGESLTGALGSGGSPLAHRPALLVATTRRPVGDPPQSPWFGAERGKGLAFARATLTPPDRSLVGRVSSVVTGDWAVAQVGPVTEGEEAAQAFAEAAFGHDTLLYIHGYRESFETAALSAAVLADGIGFRGSAALFTWPSAASTFSYVGDRESAMWSRDALEDLLLALAKSPSGGRVHIVAHSMGTLLTLETLRLLRAGAGDGPISRIGAIVMAAPDIDMDVFARSIERLGPDARKIMVISSTRDRALAVSSRLAGGVVRAGAADRERLERLGVRVADASEFGGGLINHDVFLTDPEVQQVVKRAIERERA